MEEKILKVLEEINEDILSYEGNNLFDEGLLDSLQIVDLVVELEDVFDIDIDAKYVVEENFKTKKDIISFIRKMIG